jgi:hypothetical protein
MTTLEVRRNVADGGAFQQQHGCCSYLGLHYAVLLDEQHAIRAVSAPLDALVAARLQADEVWELPWLTGGELAWAMRQAWICVRTIRIEEVP